MGRNRKINKRTQRRINSVRSQLREALMPRVSVFRSLKHIYAQIIDDQSQRTLVSCSSQEITLKDTDKTAIASNLGQELAKRAKECGIERVVFDRGRYLYHGRVKALAEGLRAGGLQV